MSRYIDADKLKQDLDAWAINLHKPTNLVREDTFVIIDEQPAADVIEVRHGHWEEKQPRYRLYKCSVCNRVCFAEMMGDETVLYDYCPNCGARMDGEEE